MTRKQGSVNTKVISRIGTGALQIYAIRWDMQPVIEVDENGKKKFVGKSYYEQQFIGKPTIEKVKEIVLSGINAVIDEKILSGFVWNGMEVWLSSENQFNYKAAYDLAVQTNGANLPVRFKFGTTEKPVYYTFNTVEELSNFYMSAMSYINACLEEGWAKKDAINWSEYEDLIKDQPTRSIKNLSEFKEMLKNGDFKELNKNIKEFNQLNKIANMNLNKK